MSLNEILAEFDAPAKTPLSAMLAGGEYVPEDAFVGIPESLPLAMGDFYGVESDPNPVTINNISLINSQIKIVAASRRGLAVTGYSGSGVIPDEAKFVMDLRFRLASNAVDGYNRGTYQLGSTTFTGATQICAPFVGITPLDPLEYDDATLLNNAVRLIANYFRCNQSYGYVELARTGNTSALYDTSGNTYSNSVRPSKSLSARMRIRLGESASGGSLGMRINLYNHAGDTIWKSSTQYSGLFNTPGYVIVGCAGPNLLINQVKLATGTTEPPW